MSHLAVTNDVLKLLRDPDHFSLQGDKSQKTLLEKTLTRALMEPDLVNTGSYYYYDLTTHAIRVTTDAVKTMKEKGFTQDHVFERQFFSALAIRVFSKLGVPSIDILPELSRVENLVSNLVFLPNEMHTKKSQYFRNASILPDEVLAYLKACAPLYKKELQDIDTHYVLKTNQDECLKAIIADIKQTPWFTCEWDDYQATKWGQ